MTTTEKSAIGSEKNGSGSEKTTEKTTEKIVRLMKANPYINNKELAEVCGITEDGVYWNMMPYAFSAVSIPLLASLSAG